MAGQVILPVGTAAVPSICFSAANGSGFNRQVGGEIHWIHDNITRGNLSQFGVTVSGNGAFLFLNSIMLRRQSTDVLELTNGTTTVYRDLMLRNLTASGTIQNTSSLTGSQATASLNLSPTWNTTGNPSLIYGRVTNTANGASANLIDLGTVAGGSLFSVNMLGDITAQKFNGVSITPTTSGTSLSIYEGSSFATNGSFYTGNSFYTSGTFHTSGGFYTGNNFYTSSDFYTSSGFYTGNNFYTSSDFYTSGSFHTSGSFYTSADFQTNGSFYAGGDFSTSGTDPVTLATPSSGAAKTYTFPTTDATLARTDAAQTFTGTQTFGAISATGGVAIPLNGTSLTVGTGSASDVFISFAGGRGVVGYNNASNYTYLGNTAAKDVVIGNATSGVVARFATTGATILSGKISASIPAYANDAAADADATLLTGQLYKITGSRQVYQKP
jgi:hypothetical protein